VRSAKKVLKNESVNIKQRRVERLSIIESVQLCTTCSCRTLTAKFLSNSRPGPGDSASARGRRKANFNSQNFERRSGLAIIPRCPFVKAQAQSARQMRDAANGSSAYQRTGRLQARASALQVVTPSTCVTRRGTIDP
jgi:hypothetical protein